jgi:hypothetical protein
VSLDYEYATIDVDILVHPKALAAGVEAMGLWLWSMAWSHKTGANGKIPRHVVALAWGGTRVTIAKLSARLVGSGLWLETEEGWEIWNYGKKNQSAEEKERKKKLGRERMARFRDRSRSAKSDAPCDAESDASPNGGVTRERPAPAPDLVSGSGSLGGTGGVMLGSPPGAPPAWWSVAVATAEQAVGGTIDQPGARWLEYDAARDRKGWARNQRDAVGWLTTVMRSERSKAPSSRAGPQSHRQPHDTGWLERMAKTGTENDL